MISFPFKWFIALFKTFDKTGLPLGRCRRNVGLNHNHSILSLQSLINVFNITAEIMDLNLIKVSLSFA